ncbi:MAG: ATP-dependent DNA helicase [Planctomycetes bacterium]|nr:ATP-dependent DNA helicase [Planctomycetota bacterium]
MTAEGITYDRKALAAVQGKTADWNELAKDAVAFASARGGTIDIGIPDDVTEPPSHQRIDPTLVERARKRLGELTVNVGVRSDIITCANGGEVLRLTVARSTAVPCRNDGKHFLRVDDTSRPIMGEDVRRLAMESTATPWELLGSGIARDDADAAPTARLVARLRASDRVKATVKEKSDRELLEHYYLSAGRELTHLGVLMIGQPLHRARLGTAPVIQAIAYDERGEKVAKWSWDDHALSPIELLEAVWTTVPAFRESYELPQGFLRVSVPAFDERVIREALVNALVHRPYNQRGDLFLNLYPDRLVLVNPGLLPLGVTPSNVLHTTVRRNEQMARLFHDLHLMEREGSGFDLMYATQLAQGKAVPVLREGPDRVEVEITRRVMKPEVVALLTKADEALQLTQRERIALGLLALHDGLTLRDLANHLELEDTAAAATWLGRLPDMGVVLTSGRTKGTRYFIAPTTLQQLDFTQPTTLARIPPHRLDALVLEDLGRYPGSRRGEIHERIGSEISVLHLKSSLSRLVAAKRIRFEGERRGRRYWSADAV